MFASPFNSEKEKFWLFCLSVASLALQVLVADSDAFVHPLAEPWAELLRSVQQKGGYFHVITTSTSLGKNLLPRAAALLDVSPVTDVTAISEPRVFVRFDILLFAIVLSISISMWDGQLCLPMQHAVHVSADFDGVACGLAIYDVSVFAYMNHLSCIGKKSHYISIHKLPFMCSSQTIYCLILNLS